MKLLNKAFTLFLVFTLAFSFTASTSSFAKGKGNGYGNVDPFSMEVFGLNGQDGTDIYIKVSKELEGYELPSELKKVQLKYVVNGETIVHNVKGIALAEGLYEVMTLTDLNAHETLEAKIHIHDSQTGDEEVLKGSTTVLLRSDVVVGDIQTPEEMIAGESFNISFPVSEINGDIGGATLVSVMHGDNELYSTVVEVAAGEEVNVTVPLLFGDAGTYELTVTASDMYFEHLGVNIEDFDVTSNTNSVTIEVIQSTQPIFFNVSYDYYEIDYVNHDNYDYNHENLWLQFYDNTYSDNGEDVYDLTKGTLTVKVEADNGYSQEWNYNMSELSQLAQETGAYHYSYEVESYWHAYYYEYYYDNNKGEYVDQYNNNYHHYYYGDHSSVYFHYYNEDNEMNLINANSIVVEATLTNAEGDTWIVTKDVILDATYSYDYEGYYYYSYYGTYHYKYKYHNFSGLTL